MRIAACFALALGIVAAAAACSDSDDGSRAGVAPLTSTFHHHPADGGDDDDDDDETDAAVDAVSATPPIANGIDPRVATILTRAGLVPGALPELDTLKTQPAKLRAVMDAFALSLGTNCFGCHVNGDYAADTPRKNVTRKMYSEFVQKLQTSAGAPIFCDTCHQARAKFLDHSSHPALRVWMNGNFVAKLARKDGTTQTCLSCHTTPLGEDFIDEWAEGRTAARDR